ncbi:DUF305 domain-containing protein [Streptosporangium sp. NPDC000396]|uniref:DUF305 domain-containing protein n=1 Tax=Streptosporangium sp. NPDC000396 TaxID=3366185 RepID=UPI0036A324A7
MFINRSVTRGLALTVTAGAGALVLLTACGSGDGATAGLIDRPSTPTTSPSQQPGAFFNDVDRMFVRMMIPHHKQAVEMAELAKTRAKSPEVKKLAAKIHADQEREIATMTGWLSAWGEPAAPSGGEEHGMSPMPFPGMGDHGMPGMMSDEDAEELEAATGAEFDRMFLRMMIPHHKGAIMMAQMEQARGVSPEARKLAETIEITQQMEIEQMQKLLDQL